MKWLIQITESLKSIRIALLITVAVLFAVAVVLLVIVRVKKGRRRKVGRRTSWAWGRFASQSRLCYLILGFFQCRRAVR